MVELALFRTISIARPGDDGPPPTPPPGITALNPIFGSSFNDFVIGNTGDRALAGGFGDDTLVARFGNDTLVGGVGSDTFRVSLAPDPDGDTLVNTVIADYEPGVDAPIPLIFPAGSSSADGIFSSFDDLLANAVEIDGGVVITLTSSQTLTLEGLTLGDLTEELFLGSVNEAQGSEFLLESYEGAGAISGSADSDLILAGFEPDDNKIFGGAGDDVLFGGGGNDQIFGNVGNDSLSGDAGDDIVFGGVGRDEILGGDGDDELYGGAGDDIVIGGAGDDSLYGGAGHDFLIGGEGADTFFFNTTGGGTVVDFDIEEDVLFLANTVTDFTDIQSILDAATFIGGIDASTQVVIDLGGGNSLSLIGFTLEQLSEATIIF
ncbi:MAG: hypothetical protein COB37_06050 [Kordiimonadales bacterium]|nr:MAG: hypothetical protein COB37_06050 [Kordiimonadales bacterium]